MTKAITLSVYIGILFTLLYGWFMNILNLINGVYVEVSTTILGFIGVFLAPVGAVIHFIAG